MHLGLPGAHFMAQLIVQETRAGLLIVLLKLITWHNLQPGSTGLTLPGTLCTKTQLMGCGVSTNMHTQPGKRQVHLQYRR